MTTEVDWRRRWKPDLKAKPWQPYEIDGSRLLIKSEFKDNSYSILITDSTSLWYEEIDSDALKKRSKKLNPNVEAPLSKLLDHIQDNIEERKKTADYKIAFTDIKDSNEKKAFLTVNTKLAGLPYVWKFMTTPADKDMVAEHLTVPLMAMVGELTRRQQELYKLLTNKDREIEDLKTQGVKVSRRHLETLPFDDTAFMNNMVLSKGFEDQVLQLGQTAFGVEGQDLYRQIMSKYAWINRDPQQALEGESLMDDGSVEPAATGGSVPSWNNRLPPSMGSGPTSANVSPKKSPVRSPLKAASSPDPAPVKDTELLRRQALERRLQQEAEKKSQKDKKKKKMKF